MDLATSVLNIMSLLWDGAARCTNHSCNLEENLKSLRNALDDLKNLRYDVVEAIEEQRLVRTHQVDRWLDRVRDTEREVTEFLNEGDTQIERRCFFSCPRNCLATHQLGKRVIKKLPEVEDLKGQQEKFNIRDKSLPPASVEPLPRDPTIGLDSIFKKVWGLLVEDHQVRIMGLYGMAGVGKTALMTKINNEFIHGTHGFEVVIWIVVSKPLNEPKIQKDILERLKLSSGDKGKQEVDEGKQEDQAKQIFKALMKKKFLLLLDDIWERVDLVKVGIPIPNIENKSKIVFTTRSEAVCGKMEAHKTIKIECLNWDEAWNLFQSKVGKNALNSHPKIPKLAQVIAKECGGLPLALITIGRAMAFKKTPEQWEHAITVLEKSKFSDEENEVFGKLNFSYENLPSDTVRSCFLYCSLYPEDYSIYKEELIDQWIGEGFMDESEDLRKARLQGHDIIGILKATCMLERGYDEEWHVKMHDLIRDFALWKACECGQKKYNYVVEAGLRLRGAPEVDKWSDTERLSLVSNEFGELRGAPSCPNLLTLMLQQNYKLQNISTGFFRFMPALRVLNLQGTKIRELPIEITELVELRYLNLSYTDIEQLPSGLKNWGKLKYLSLKGTRKLHKIPHGEIKMLSSLQELNLHGSAFSDWEVKHNDSDQCTPSLGELECLKHLKSLGITIKTIPVLQRLLSNNELRMCIRSLNIEECHGLTSISWAEEEESCLESLVLHRLPNLKIIWERPQKLLCFQNLRIVQINSCHALKDLTWLLHAQSLQALHLSDCEGIEEIIHGEITTVQEELKTFSRLEDIAIYDLPNLKSICMYALPFPSLKYIQVYQCPKVNKLPLDSNSANNTLQWIRGRQEWWDRLEWEDAIVKSVFQNKFLDLPEIR